jgi:1,4-alpha-glucan branching enzyme
MRKKKEEMGYWCLVLHSHLPYVRHPEYEDFLEEDWFYEAVIETYIPLAQVIEGLINDGVDFRLTISFSPTLMHMLRDELLNKRLVRRMDKLIELSEKEVWRTRYMAEFHETAKMYNKLFTSVKKYYEDCRGDILGRYKKFQDEGKIEIITCCGTHAFLPLKIQRKTWHAQVHLAAQYYLKVFGKKLTGIWLPECAYIEGIDEELKKEGIRFFFLEAHGILYGTPRPKYGTFAPIYCPSGVAAFGRDMETAHQVWSADVGYPGDFDYREFYRDVGYDLDYDYIRPYLHSDGVRRNVGIKYYRITGRGVPLHAKEPYNREWALNKAATHAGNFMFNRERQIEYLYNFLNRKPIIVSPYDTELFGHWWFEGIDFLNFLFRKIYYDQEVFTTITPSEYLHLHPKNQIVQPAASSWGDKGYFEVWLNGTNDWLYRHLHKAEERMVELATANAHHAKARNYELRQRALNQLARELLLAEASDWPFIMTTGTTVPYAERRFCEHILRFNALYEQIKRDAIDEKFLSELEWRDNIFPDIDYRIYAENGGEKKCAS